MTKNVLLCGVGGQGTVLASRLIALAAMEKGMEARGAETIGMAQRGGSVVSHVRIGEEIHSPLIPYKAADVIIGFEPAEAVRCLPYLKKGGCMVVSPVPIRPVTASLTGGAYTGNEMMEYLKQTVDNLVLLGAAIASGLIGISLEEMEQAILKRVPEKFRAMNVTALNLGAASEHA